jgi:hypothetical protein
LLNKQGSFATNHSLTLFFWISFQRYQIKVLCCSNF